MHGKIKRDKWVHFFTGIPMGFIVALISSWMFPGSLYLCIAMGVVVIVAVSYGFELLSLVIKKGVYDLYDALASILGGFLGFISGLLM